MTFTGIVSGFSTQFSQEINICDGVKLKLPDDWIEIPKDKIDSTYKIVAETTETEMVYYDFGYQWQQNKGYFSYPYLLIQVNESLRIPESELDMYKFNQGLNDGIESDEVSNIVDSISVGESVFDPIKNRVLTKFGMESYGVEMTGFMDLQLTNKGYVMIYMYSIDSELAQYESLFTQIMDNIEITQDAKYIYKDINNTKAYNSKNDKSDQSIFSKVLSGIVAAAILGGISFLVNSLRRKKKDNEIESNIIYDYPPQEQNQDSNPKESGKIVFYEDPRINEGVLSSDDVIPEQVDKEKTEPQKEIPALTIEDQNYDTIYCRNCGKQLPSDSKFCFKCGKDVIK